MKHNCLDVLQINYQENGDGTGTLSHEYMAKIANIMFNKGAKSCSIHFYGDGVGECFLYDNATVGKLVAGGKGLVPNPQFRLVI